MDLGCTSENELDVQSSLAAAHLRVSKHTRGCVGPPGPEGSGLLDTTVPLIRFAAPPATSPDTFSPEGDPAARDLSQVLGGLHDGRLSCLISCSCHPWDSKSMVRHLNKNLSQCPRGATCDQKSRINRGDWLISFVEDVHGIRWDARCNPKVRRPEGYRGPEGHPYLKPEASSRVTHHPSPTSGNSGSRTTKAAIKAQGTCSWKDQKDATDANPSKDDRHLSDVTLEPHQGDTEFGAHTPARPGGPPPTDDARHPEGRWERTVEITRM